MHCEYVTLLAYTFPQFFYSTIISRPHSVGTGSSYCRMKSNQVWLMVTTHFNPLLRLKMCGALPSSPHITSMVWYLSSKSVILYDECVRVHVLIY